MTNMDAILAADLAVTLFDTSLAESPAQDVTYTPKGGVGVTVVGVLLAADTELTDDSDGTIKHVNREMIVQLDGDNAIDPAPADSVTIGSDTYQVAAVTGADASKAILSLVAIDVESRHNENFKKRETIS